MNKLLVKPYGVESERKENIIDEFTDEELDLIEDLFKSLSDKCVKTFQEIKEVFVKRKGDIIEINYKLDPSFNLSEDEVMFYIESLTGYCSENIIYFGEEKFFIRGEPIEPMTESEKMIGLVKEILEEDV